MDLSPHWPYSNPNPLQYSGSILLSDFGIPYSICAYPRSYRKSIIRNSDFKVELSVQLLPCSILSGICYCGVVWSSRVEASQHCTHHRMCQQHSIFQWSSWDDTLGHFNGTYRSFLEVSSDRQVNLHIMKWLWRTSTTQKKQWFNWKWLDWKK